MSHFKSISNTSPSRIVWAYSSACSQTRRPPSALPPASASGRVPPTAPPSLAAMRFGPKGRRGAFGEHLSPEPLRDAHAPLLPQGAEIVRGDGLGTSSEP